MKSSKKIVSLITCLVIVFSMFLPNFSLALETGKPELKITTDKSEVKRGEEVVVTVSLNTNSVADIAGLEITLVYDTNVFEPIQTWADGEDPAPTRLLPKIDTEIALSSIDTTKGYVAFAWTDYSGTLTYNGDVFSTKFKVKDDATIGNTSLKFRYEPENSQYSLPIQDVDGNELTSTFVEPTVNIILPVESITLNKDTSTLWVGETDTLTVTYDPADTNQKGVTWSTSAEDKVSVAQDGTITAKAKGSATITATTSNGKTATCNVTVQQQITGVTLNKNTLDLDKDTSEKLIATILPDNADGDKTITWSSSAEDKVSVAQDGTVTALEKGNAVITATTSNGEKATCNVTVGIPLTSISFEGITSEDVKKINKGDSFNLVVKYNPEDTDADKTVRWETSNSAIASVDDTGKVTAVDDGEATITAYVGEKTAICKVKVDIPLNSISIKESTKINYGQTEKLLVTYDPEDTTEDKTITWKSSDPDKVSVAQDGTITAKAVGTATITAETTGKKTDTCTVEVLAVPIDTISITEQNISLNKGETKTLTVTYYPEITSETQAVTWESSDPDKVSVDQNGTITAKAAAKGNEKVTITAKVDDNRVATTTVEVEVPLQNISLNHTEFTLDKTAGQTVDLNVTYNPDDTTDSKDIEWKTSDDKVATVDDNGLVTPVSGGTTYIIAKVKEKNIEASCKITVEVPLEGIELDDEKLEVLKGQKDIYLSYTLKPTGTTFDDSLTWESSDPDKVSVDQNGKITALKGGTTTITVKATENGNEFSDTCILTVNEIPLDSITIDTIDFELGLTREKQLGVIYEPKDTTDDRTVTWKSSNPDVVSVDANGIVKALKVGTATITATVGTETASVEVTTKEVAVESIKIPISNPTIVLGATFNIGALISPFDATNTKLIYSSSDSNILTIDEDGNVIAKNPGKAIVTVQAENGVKNQIELTVADSQEEQSKTNTNNSNSPKTGDIAVELFIALMIISVLGIAIIIGKNKLKK